MYAWKQQFLKYMGCGANEVPLGADMLLVHASSGVYSSMAQTLPQ